MRFHTILQLGSNRELTREGFTVFRNVSISRIGEQVYGANEGIGIEPGPGGRIYITRTPDEVFRPETLDSGNGKSLCLLHPDDDVLPGNWRELTNGFMANLRRGSGEQRDECIADIFVTTQEAIDAIDNEMREVSLGYDADYFQTGPGRGEQRNIYINHIALVPSGRCGSTCAIRDHHFLDTEEEFEASLHDPADNCTQLLEDSHGQVLPDAIKAANARRHRKPGDSVWRAPTADELMRMTPTQRFIHAARQLKEGRR